MAKKKLLTPRIQELLAAEPERWWLARELAHSLDDGTSVGSVAQGLHYMMCHSRVSILSDGKKPRKYSAWRGEVFVVA